MNTRPGRPRLVVTLPGRTISELRDEAERAARSGGDWAEIRVDRLPPTERGRLADLFPSPIPLLATLRSREEGGEGPDDPRERDAERGRWASLPFVAFDLERARDPAPENRGSGSSAVCVWSRHASSSGALREALDEGRARPRVAAGHIEKTVGPATMTELIRDVLPLVPVATDSAFVVHTTGPSGPVLRAWAARQGMALIYCALPGNSDPRAPVEASQIPVDALHRYLRGSDGRGPLFAVVGHPVEHSRSPGLHGAWIQEDRRSALYLALDIADGPELAYSLPALVEGGFVGLNVTHPLKAAALDAADRRDTDASACRCANTLRFGSGRVEAFNTDLVALRRRLAELVERGRWDGERALVLGAGGSARAALVALRERGARVAIRARREDAARALVREFGVDSVAGGSPRDPSLVVHATPSGRAQQGRIPSSWIEDIVSGSYVLDFVYTPDDPYLRLESERRGAAYEDGTRLLVYQAAASYALWWGEPPSAEALARVPGEPVECAA